MRSSAAAGSGRQRLVSSRQQRKVRRAIPEAPDRFGVGKTGLGEYGDGKVRLKQPGMGGGCGRDAPGGLSLSRLRQDSRELSSA
jgi:hypothetical protein